MPVDGKNLNEKFRNLVGDAHYVRTHLEQITMIIENLRGCRRVLDIGSGPGYITGPLTNKGIDIAVGLDSSWERLEEFRITNLNLPAGWFGQLLGEVGGVPYHQP